LSYHISIETFFVVQNFSYKYDFCTSIEKAINENLENISRNGMASNEHFLVPPWRSKGTKIKSYDHKLKIAAATILIYEKVHLITNYFMNVLLLSIICK